MGFDTWNDIVSLNAEDESRADSLLTARSMNNLSLRDLLSQMSSASGQVLGAPETTPALGFADLLRDPRSTAYSLVGNLRDELHLSPPPQASAMAPSMTSVFPRFSYPDVNL